MLNLNDVLQLTSEQKRIIQQFGVLSPEHWDRNKTKLKDAIRERLKLMQNKCCVYCGCRVQGGGDVEHIAHKAAHPQFLFTPENLAYSCKNCNQVYKGQRNVVSLVNTDYKRCRFTIVHPYLDDVDHYFDTSKPIIAIRPGLSQPERTKAVTTKRMFHWEDPEVTEQRAMAVMAREYAVEHHTSIDQVLYENVLTYIPGEI